MKPPVRIPHFSLPTFPHIVIFPEGTNLFPEGVIEVQPSSLLYYMVWDSPVACIAACLDRDNILNSDREFLKAILPQYSFDDGRVARVLEALNFPLGLEPIITISISTKPLMPGIMKALAPLFRISKDSEETRAYVTSTLSNLRSKP